MRFHLSNEMTAPTVSTLLNGCNDLFVCLLADWLAGVSRISSFKSIDKMNQSFQVYGQRRRRRRLQSMSSIQCERIKNPSQLTHAA